MKKDFNEYRFEGLNFSKVSNKYLTMNRLNDAQDRIVVKVADCHLMKTKFGFALILDKTHVVFLKDWQVSENFYGNEVLLTKDYFNVKEWGEHENFSSNEDALKFDYWLNIAKEQEENAPQDDTIGNLVRWAY